MEIEVPQGSPVLWDLGVGQICPQPGQDERGLLAQARKPCGRATMSPPSDEESGEPFEACGARQSGVTATGSAHKKRPQTLEPRASLGRSTSQKVGKRAGPTGLQAQVRALPVSPLPIEMRIIVEIVRLCGTSRDPLPGDILCSQEESC